MLKNKNFSLLYIFFVSLSLALFPWDSVYKSIFVDRYTYYILITHYENRIHYVDFDSVLSYITEEWFWSFLTFLWHDYLKFDINYFFLIISFLLVYTSLLVLRLHGVLYLSIFFVNPIFIEFFYSQLRLALAMSIIFMAYYLFKTKGANFIGFFLLLLSLFIHTTSIIFILLIFSFIFIKKDISRFIFSILIPVFLSLMTGTYRYSFLSYIGDRRAEYSDMSGDWYILILYYIILFTMIITWVIKVRAKSFPEWYYISLSSLSLCFFSYVFHSYPSRFLVALYPFVLMGVVLLPKHLKILAILGNIFYILFAFVFWTGI